MPSHLTHNKKAVAYIAYILLIMLAVAIATMISLWSKSTTEEMTKSTVNLASGRLECKEVKIDAIAQPGCASLRILNKGTINIENVKLTFDDVTQADSGVVIVSSEISVDASAFSQVELLPIVKERGNLFGCQDKKLLIKCS